MNLPGRKTVVFATLGTVTTALHFATLHVRLFGAAVLTPTAVDAAIPFLPLFVVPYLSFFLLVLLPLLVISHRRGPWGPLVGVGVVGLFSSPTVVLWPAAASLFYL